MESSGIFLICIYILEAFHRYLHIAFCGKLWDFLNFFILEALPWVSPPCHGGGLVDSHNPES